MRAVWPDGRAVLWTEDAGAVGDRAIISMADLWLMGQGGTVVVTPTGPSVPADWSDQYAAYTAIKAVAPGAEWEGAPDMTFGAPDDAVF